LDDGVGWHLLRVDSSGGAPEAALRLAYEQDAVLVIEDDTRDRGENEERVSGDAE
jgi:hypothetical protein